MRLSHLKATPRLKGAESHKRPNGQNKTEKTEVRDASNSVDSQDSLSLTSSSQKQAVSKTVVQRLRKSSIRAAVYVATSLSLFNPINAWSQDSKQSTTQDTAKEVKFQAQRDLSDAYLVTPSEIGNLRTENDSTKVRTSKVEIEQDSTKSLLGYDIDTRFARLSASPKYKDGELQSKVKASLVTLSLTKEWETESGTQVRRGLSTRLRYEGMASLGEENGFQFESKFTDLELGLEQRYDKMLTPKNQLTHRYFAGARYRFRFGDESGSEYQAMIQTHQRLSQPKSFQLFGQDFGWEANAKQTFVTRWGQLQGNGMEGVFEVDGLLTKRVDLKVLGKKRTIELKAGPEFEYSSRDGFQIAPKAGMKVRF